MRKSKNLLLPLLPRINVCVFIGALLINFALIQNSFPADINISWQKSGISDDSSGLGSNGPIIIYEKGSIQNYSVTSSGTDYIISKNNISKTDSLFCYVDETKRKFGFILKDTIKAENDTYDLPEKMFMISDVHGNFKGLEMILTGAGVTDENLNWSFGKGHLIFDGDIFDKGTNVTEILWLIYKLENEAQKQGGKVHFVLGNHEIMNLNLNCKYIKNKYFVVSDTLKLEYKKWYAPDTELGRWLRSKNCIEKIGDYLFLHAGISKDFPEGVYSISDINDNIKKRIDSVYSSGELAKDIFIGKESPIWYRGLAQEKETQAEVEKTLLAFGASKMILGHTIIDNIKYLYGEKVILINVDHRMNSGNGKMFALWFENNKFSVVDNKGNKTNLK